MKKVVAYNTQGNDTDKFLAIAKRTAGAIGFSSIANLKSALCAAHDAGSIDILIIADHGATGHQGMGSGVGRGTRPDTNLIHSSFDMAKLLPPNVTIGDMQAPTAGTFGAYQNPLPKDQRRDFKNARLSIAGAFTNTTEIGHIREISTRLRKKSDGLLLFLGCEVGAGHEGASLVLGIALAIQNSNAASVMACKYKTHWVFSQSSVSSNADLHTMARQLKHAKGATTVSPALSDPNKPLQSSDMIGYRGLRELNYDQKTNYLAQTAIPLA